MSKRRSISVRGTTYKRLKTYCKQEKLSLSNALEQFIADDMDKKDVPVPDAAEPPRRTKPREEKPEPAGPHGGGFHLF